MANLLLTNCCTRSCPYCFAGKHISDSSQDDFLCWEDLIYVADFLQRSGENRISLMGGEPTLHPYYTDFLMYLIARGFWVCTFTSGIMSDCLAAELDDALGDVPSEQASFVCNINDPALSPSSEVNKIRCFLELAGPRTTPGFNIYRTDFSLDFLFEYINAFGLQRHLRLGIAHPIHGHENCFIRPSDMKQVAGSLASYFPKFELHKVSPGLDCGFPLCSFSNEQIGWLYTLKRGQLTFGCGPAVDIGPEMSVWSCFPLSSFRKRSLYEFSNMGELKDFFSKCHHDVRVEVGGIFEECDQCTHRESGVCAGGCLAHALNSMDNEAPVRALLRLEP